MSNVAKGKLGEEMALCFLQQQGFRLLKRNYRAGHKEIDLVMRQGDTIVFIEVKARNSTAYGTPAEAVGFRKQRNLLEAAQTFLAQNGYYETSARFDVVEVDLGKGLVRHIPNAFMAEA